MWQIKFDKAIYEIILTEEIEYKKKVCAEARIYKRSEFVNNTSIGQSITIIKKKRIWKIEFDV